MSLESGRKFGYYSSLMNVILPIVTIGVTVTFFIAIIASAARGIISGTTAPAFSGFFSGGLNIFFIAIGACGVASFVMFMYAMYNLSKYYNEPAIFKNVLYAFIVSIVSGAIIIALVFAVLISAITGISPTNTPSTLTPIFMQIILAYVVVGVVALAFGIVSGYLYMRAFNKLKEKTGVDNFGTAGLLYLIGVFIPFIMWIAWIFAAMGFNKLKTAPAVSPHPSYSTQQPLSSTMLMKRCPNCGADNYGDSSYCRNCGKTLQ